MPCYKCQDLLCMHGRFVQLPLTRSRKKNLRASKFNNNVVDDDVVLKPLFSQTTSYRGNNDHILCMS